MGEVEVHPVPKRSRQTRRVREVAACRLYGPSPRPAQDHVERALVPPVRKENMLGTRKTAGLNH